MREGPSVSGNNLWAEFRACMAMGIDPDVQFAKERHMRTFIVAGNIAARAIDAMSAYDTRVKPK